jgi:hypothetical protein
MRRRQLNANPLFRHQSIFFDSDLFCHPPSLKMKLLQFEIQNEGAPSITRMKLQFEIQNEGA